MNKIQLELQKIDWEKLIKVDSSMNQNYNIFSSTLDNILNERMPLNQVKIKKNKKIKIGSRRAREFHINIKDFLKSM